MQAPQYNDWSARVLPKFLHMRAIGQSKLWLTHGLHMEHISISATRACIICMLLQELNSSSAVRASGLGLTGMKALSPFVSGLIVSDGKWCAADARLWPCWPGCLDKRNGG